MAILRIRNANDDGWIVIGGSVIRGVIQDADGDTKIQVEESADEDVIRFDCGGTEMMALDSDGLSGTAIDNLPFSPEWTFISEVDVSTGDTGYALFSSLPATFTEGWLFFFGVSNDTNLQPPILQLQDSTGYVTAGYTSFTQAMGDTGDAHSNGVQLHDTALWNSTDTCHGYVTIHRMDGDDSYEYFIEGAARVVGETYFRYYQSFVTLSGLCIGARVTTDAGAATFNAGTFWGRYR